MTGRRIASVFVFLALSAALLLVGCSNTEAKHNGLQVSATFFPLYEAAKEIAGDKATITSIVPNGVEPHDYDPTSSDITGIGNADVFIETGVGFGTVEQKLSNGLGGGTIIVNASEGVGLVQGGQDASASAGQAGSASTGVDPHFWLSPKRMIIVADNVKAGLEQVDPSNTAVYETNTADFKRKLQALDSEYRSGLVNCKKDTILTSHDAFGYLASDYGFKQIYISGLSPDAEPTPQALAQLVDTAKNDNITVIFFEDLVDPRIAQTIAGEVGAQTMVLSPLEGSKNQNDDYFSLMRKNLERLRIALECG